MILITLDPKDSFEILKRQIQEAIGQKFSPDDKYKYEIMNTWPDKQLVLVQDWNEGKYFEIPYSIDVNGNIEIGEATEASNIYVPTKETILNSMKEGQELILINNSTDKAIYRSLVQTPTTLNYNDMGLGDFEYKEDAIKTAIDGLIGMQVFDDAIPKHARQRGQTPIPFADIVNAGYCPEYGGYIDIEVFRPEYVATMDNTLKKLKDGKTVNEGFSTEVNIIDVVETGENQYAINNMEYDGIVWTNRPRDKNAKLCDVLLNSKFNPKGDDILTKIELSQEDYDALKAKETELETLKVDYSKGEKLYNKGKELYEKAQTKITELTDALNPFLEAQETQKTELINSILEVEPELKKEDLEAKDFIEVKKIQLINSIVTKQPKGKQAEIKTNLEALDIEGINNVMKFGTLLNSTEGGGSTGGAVGGSRGSGRSDKPLFEDPEKQARYEAAQNLPSTQASGIIESIEKGDE